MNTLQAIYKRTSTRKYIKKDVPHKIIELLVDAGRRAPTARCVEPWEFVVITDSEQLKKIAQIAQNGNFIKDAPCAIIVLCKETKYYLEDGCRGQEGIL